MGHPGKPNIRTRVPRREFYELRIRGTEEMVEGEDVEETWEVSVLQDQVSQDIQ